MKRPSESGLRPPTLPATQLTRWTKSAVPQLETLRNSLRGEGLTVREWVDPAGTVYPVHAHDYPEARAVVFGQLRIGLPETGEEFILAPGDRLDLPPNIPHWEDVIGNRPAIHLSAFQNGHTRHRKRKQAFV